jgi:hypothetical protein
MPVLLRRVLVVLAVAGAGLVPVPATAAGYCAGSGVSIVVDFGALGGGVVKGCDSSGNRNAAKAFENTGHHLTYASRQPGFVCRVDGVPQSDPCVNTSPSNAYWGLYWSDGTSGWKYSSLGAGSLTVPSGATVAFSWQNGGTADPPGAAPAAPAPKPSPSPTPTKRPTAQPTKKPASGASVPAGATGSASALASPSASATTSVSGSATPSTTATPSASASPTASGQATVSQPEVTSGVTDDGGGGGLPWWVPVGVLLALGAGGVAAWWTRRRDTA